MVICTSFSSSPASAETSVVSGVESAVGTVNHVVRFSIEAFDEGGGRLAEGGDLFLVNIRGPSRTHARVADHLNGRYSVEWVPSTSGQYDIAVTIRGRLLPGAPFIFNVLEPQPYAPNCELRGDALTTARAREPQSFEVAFRDQLNHVAPAVELEVFVEHAGLPSVSPVAQRVRVPRDRSSSAPAARPPAVRPSSRGCR